MLPLFHTAVRVTLAAVLRVLRRQYRKKLEQDRNDESVVQSVRASQVQYFTMHVLACFY